MEATKRSRRIGWMLAAGLAVLAIVASLHLPARPEPDSLRPEPARAASEPVPRGLSTVRQASPSAASSAASLLSIRGFVLGPKGPLPGARVLVSAAVEGESLSSLPCGRHREVSMLECAWSGQADEIIARVAERRGEAPVRAQVLTAADGSFLVSGLEDGSYALWVESPEGVAFRPAVVAGAEPVELSVRPGARVSGRGWTTRRGPCQGRSSRGCS